MVRKLDPKDFRAARKILEPSDFAVGGQTPDTKPTSLVSQKTWNGIMNLPSDVSIRTTNH